MAEKDTTQYIDLPNYEIKADKDWELTPSEYNNDIGSTIVNAIRQATKPTDVKFLVDDSFTSVQCAESYGSGEITATLHSLAQKFGNNVFSLGIPGVGFIYGMLKSPPSLSISSKWSANGVSMLIEMLKKLAQDDTYQSIVQMLGSSQLPPILRRFYNYKNV